MQDILLNHLSVQEASDGDIVISAENERGLVAESLEVTSDDGPVYKDLPEYKRFTRMVDCYNIMIGKDLDIVRDLLALFYPTDGEKSDLQVILELHKKDVQFNVTSLDHASVAVSPHVHAARTIKQGGIIEMGVDAQLVHEIAAFPDKWRFLLLAVRHDRFKELKNS